MFKDFVEMYSK